MVNSFGLRDECTWGIRRADNGEFTAEDRLGKMLFESDVQANTIRTPSTGLRADTYYCQTLTVQQVLRLPAKGRKISAVQDSVVRGKF